MRKVRWTVLLAGVLAIQLAMSSFAADTVEYEAGNYKTADGTVIEGAVAKGITVSKYQNKAGAIDWDRVAADQVKFAMVRLGYHNDLDPYFEENMRAAVSHGIQTGIFFYTQALNTATAQEEARFVLDMIKGYPVSYPVAYDVESQYLLDQGLTKQQITDQINTFCGVIEAAGYRPVVYGNEEWITNHMDVTQIPYDIWYARYRPDGYQLRDCAIWQYTENGSVDGISGEVCIELAFQDYKQLFPGTGWRNINGEWYYYQNYSMVTGWLELAGSWYYLTPDGIMISGETRTIDGVEYQFDDSGKAVL